MAELFNYSRHKADAIASYAEVRPIYEKYTATLKQLLDIFLSGLPIHTIEARAKTILSFANKATKPSREDASKPEYPSPLKDITDLAAARIITYFPDALRQVEEIIGKEFTVIERSDKSVAFEKSGRLGYQSIHFLVRLGPARAPLREYSAFADLVCEIQIRTILQHAWAEMEHDIQYKSPEQIPTEIRRRFAALAGLIEIADREFQAIQDADADLKNSIKALLVTGTPVISESTSETEHQEQGIENAVSEQVSSEQRLSNEWLTTATIRGDYTEAVQKYTGLIEKHPAQYTLYLGRAKAKFLGGDRTGALRDLDEAEELSPGAASIQLVRRKIDEGIVGPSSDSKYAATAAVLTGHEQLAKGDGDAALRSYKAAEALGYSRVLGLVYKAMALIILGLFDDAKNELQAVTPHSASHVKVNIEVLREVNRVLQEQDDIVQLDAIRHALAEMPSYDFSLSPLRSFLAAMPAKFSEAERLKLEPIFELVRKDQGKR